MFGPSSGCGIKGPTTTSYDVSPDGQRFLKHPATGFSKQSPEDPLPAIRVIPG
jgi:hypothetical protein